MLKKFLSPDRAAVSLFFPGLRAIFAAGMLLYGAGCASTPEAMLTASGTYADISYSGGKLENVELLALQHDTLFVLGDSFVAIPQGSLKTVSLKIVEERGWMYYVVIVQSVPAAVLALTEDQFAQTLGVVLGGVAIGTWAALEFSGPQTVFRFPLDETDLKTLALHLRFPYGVERNKLAQIGPAVWRTAP